MSKREADEENVCSFFLERKKRHCRMKTNDGMSYCPHHSHLGSDHDPKKGARIPCPFDSSHFCYESKLQKHLKICNAREKEKPKYFKENVNSDPVDNLQSLKLCLRDISDDELLGFIEKVNTLYDETQLTISEISSMHPLLKEEMDTTNDGFNSFKHMKQQAALLSVLEEHSLLKDGSCFVEFGAGKGQLMYWVIKCVPDNANKSFVLIDRSAQRHKSDNKFKDSELKIQRIRIDIQHLFLGNMADIQPNLDKVVGISKHLCGAATDLAVRCLMNTLTYENGSEKIQHKACGLLMALCCHHRCSWSSYVGKDFMQKHGFSEREFQLMCCIAGWATCGSRKEATKNETEDLSKEHSEENQIENVNRYEKLNLKHEERELIGLKCKRLMDAGRIEYLVSKDYDARLVTYIDKSVSLENVALLAICNKK